MLHHTSLKKMVRKNVHEDYPLTLGSCKLSKRSKALGTWPKMFLAPNYGGSDREAGAENKGCE